MPTATLDEREHFTGCPATRTERDQLQAPDGTWVVRTRCIDCGGQSVARKDK